MEPLSRLPHRARLAADLQGRRRRPVPDPNRHALRSVLGVNSCNPTCNHATKTRRNWVDDRPGCVPKTQPLSTRRHPSIWPCSGSIPVVPAIKLSFPLSKTHFGSRPQLFSPASIRVPEGVVPDLRRRAAVGGDRVAASSVVHRASAKAGRAIARAAQDGKPVQCISEMLAMATTMVHVRVAAEKALPSEVRVPNATTVKAMRAAGRGKGKRPRAWRLVAEIPGQVYRKEASHRNRGSWRVDGKTKQRRPGPCPRWGSGTVCAVALFKELGT
jgi:hypothetical protein